MEIITKRFLLRDFSENDLAALSAYRSDPRYAEFCSEEEVSPEFTEGLLNLFIKWAGETPRRNFQLAITKLKEPFKLLGSCGLRSEGYDNGQAELGIELAPDYWGRYRYAIEIAGAVLDFGFGSLGLQEVRGVSIDANARIARLAQRYGFQVTAIHSDSDFLRHKGWTQVEWTITREVWKKTTGLK